MVCSLTLPVALSVTSSRWRNRAAYRYRKVDMEFLQFGRKTASLARACRYPRSETLRPRSAPSGNIDIAPKRQIGRTQHAFGLKVFGVNRRIVRYDPAGEHANFSRMLLSIKPPKQTQSAQHGQRYSPICSSRLFRRHQNRTVFTRNGFAAVALHFQITLRDFGRYLSV